jgi:hypothetical protein
MVECYIELLNTQTIVQNLFLQIMYGLINFSGKLNLKKPLYVQIILTFRRQ